jgi:hypothetical protein
MSKDDVVVLTLRLSSIIIFLSALSKVPSTLANWANVGEVSVVSILVMIVLPALIAIILWIYAYSLAKVFVSPTPTTAIESKWSLSDVETTAFTIIGIYVLTSAIPDAFYMLSFIIQASAFGASKTEPGFVPRYIYTGTQLFIGFWLLFGAKGLHDFLRKADRSS